MTYLDGDKEVLKILREFPKNVGKNAILAAERKAAKPIVSEARNILKQVSTKTKGNLDGFEHLRALAKATKAVTVRSRSGKSINVQIDSKFPDLPMSSKRKFWSVWGVANLYVKGRKKANGTGTTDGVGSWVETAGVRTKSIARKIFRDGLEAEVKKAIDRTVRRYGKRV